MTYIPDSLRRLVYSRAQSLCEYCYIEDRYTGKTHEVDHIYAEKHDGLTVAENLCLSCLTCNRNKGSDLCSIDPATGEITRLFHPRRDRWKDHFTLSNGEIQGITPQGRVTAKILQLNIPERLAERRALIRIGRYSVKPESS
jgi:hypothetical protein